MITIDGSQGEGGGQILRTALTLSMVTGKPFTIENIRARRAKPGLMRQHLTCVKAAAEISGADHDGAEVGSARLSFWPKQARAGAYSFAVGTAGSTTLVLQTVLPALMLLDAPSSVTVTGGTHNQMAPSFDFLDQAFLPLMRRMGYDVHASLMRRGFYPAGGGEIQLSVGPRQTAETMVLMEAGQRLRQEARAIVANLPYSIAEREAEAFRAAMNWPLDSCLAREDAKAPGPGNVLIASLVQENVTEVFTGFGRQGVTAERVAHDLAAEVKAYLKAGMPVGEHLADQLLLPMALGAGGMFVTSRPTEHFRTNMRTIGAFVDEQVSTEQIDSQRWQVAVRGA
jgi:RNA 3'-terminal phosphate cyclase (ATP)